MTQLYQVFIKASPEQIWEAITTPDITEQYFHTARVNVSPERYISHGPDGTAWGDGPVLEFDPPRKLVHEWRSLYDPELAKEEPSRVTWEIEARDGGQGAGALPRAQGPPRRLPRPGRPVADRHVRQPAG